MITLDVGTPFLHASIILILFFWLLKLLRKEADLLRNNVLKAEAVTKAAKKKYDEEAEKKRQLDKQFKAANDIRQEVYAHLQSLRKLLYEKVII